MNMLRRLAVAAVVSVLAVSLPCRTARAASAQELNQGADRALQSLYRISPVAEGLSHKARGILVFPSIVKAAFIFGGAYGEGVLREGGRTVSYYNSFTASLGLQAGGQAYGYVVFLMSDKILNYLNDSAGWEIGVGPTVVVTDMGAAKNFSSSSMQSDAYAFIFGQQGLMVGISLEGTKITRINR